MNKDTCLGMMVYDAVYTTIPGITCFVAGAAIDDVYVFVAGALLIAIGIVIATGAKIINRIDEAARDPPQPYGSRLSALPITR